MTTIRYLGGGTLFPPATGDAPCCLMNDRIMVDTGYYATVRMQAFGLHVGLIDHLLITHYHPDHVIGLPLFISHRNGLPYIGKEMRHLTILGPDGPLQKLLQNTRRFLELPDDFSPGTVVPMKPDQVHEDDAFVITAFEATHPVPGRIYRIRDKETGKEVGMSWDTAYNEKNSEYFQGVDLLVHDAVHTKPEEAARTALDAGAGRLSLIHRDNRDEIRGAASAVFPTAEFPADGELIEV